MMRIWSKITSSLYKMASFPSFLYGVLIGIAGLCVYLTGVLVGFARVLLQVDGQWLWVADRLVWYSGMPVVLGLVLICYDLFVLFPHKRRMEHVRWAPPSEHGVTVVLTAFNDALSIGAAVEDFKSHRLVKRVIVVDNNSTDRTFQCALAAGAVVVKEPLQGYGSCVYRALSEGLGCTDTELTLLCEGDMTFRAYDIEKFMAYLPHADIVNGTRICEQLREQRTQLSTFMYYGNFFAGKLLEVKHLGRGTFTDVGTTYKLCRNRALERLMPHLNPGINLEFNAHFLDTALAQGLAVVECPITFHNRVGCSKGGNSSNFKALKVGSRMIFRLVAGWRKRR